MPGRGHFLWVLSMAKPCASFLDIVPAPEDCQGLGGSKVFRGLPIQKSFRTSAL